MMKCAQADLLMGFSAFVRGPGSVVVLIGL